MIMTKKPAKVVCVQSSKGGVGKTLISTLISAWVRREKEHPGPVILLDLDFTGTSLVDAIDFDKMTGRGRIHDIPVQIHGASANGAFIAETLVELFDKRLQGKEVSEILYSHASSLFPLKDTDSTLLLMGSGGKREATKKSQKGKEYGDTLAHLGITADSILIDDNHADWFVDFLIDVIDYVASKPKAGTPLFVLDNAPGQTALVRKIRHRLIRELEMRCAFFHITSPDLMDIAASVDDCHQLVTDFEKFQRAVDCVCKVFSAGPTDEGWAQLLEAKRSGELDGVELDKFVTAIANELDDASQKKGELLSRLACHSNARRGPQVSIVVNRLMPTIEIEQIDRLISDAAKKLENPSPISGVPIIGIDTLDRIAFPFSYPLALFFQEDSLMAGAATREYPLEPGSASPPPPAKKALNPQSLSALVELDATLFTVMKRLEVSGDMTATQRRVIAGLDPTDFSHVLRGLHLAAKLLGVAHDIARDVFSSKVEFLRPTERFADIFIHLLAQSIRHDERATKHPLATDQGIVVKLVGGDVGSKDEDAPAFKKLIMEDQALANRIETSFSVLLGYAFEHFAYFTAYPNYFSDANREPIAPWADLLKKIKDLASAILSVSVENQRPSELCKNLADRISEEQSDSDGLKVGGIYAHHLALGHIAHDITLYCRSLRNAGATTALMRWTIDTAANITSLDPKAALYVQTVLTDLLRGVRTDVDAVGEAIAPLLMLPNQRPTGEHPTLTRDMQSRLGTLVRPLMGDDT